MGFEPNDEGAFGRKVHIGISDNACADKFDCENLVGVVATPKKWVAYLDQVHIELKIGPTDPCWDFIDIFGTELGFFGKTDHRVPFDLQNAARRILSITEWTAKKAPEILHEIVIACSHTDSHTERGRYKGYLNLYSCCMAEDDLHQLLIDRIQHQGVNAKQALSDMISPISEQKPGQGHSPG